jgi:hypothetical protein
MHELFEKCGLQTLKEYVIDLLSRTDALTSASRDKSNDAPSEAKPQNVDGWQPLAPPGLNVPAPQGVQADEPSASAKVLAAHGAQAVAPSAEKCPTGHGAHRAVGPSENVPAGQAEQLTAPADLPKPLFRTPETAIRNIRAVSSFVTDAALKTVASLWKSHRSVWLPSDSAATSPKVSLFVSGR